MSDRTGKPMPGDTYGLWTVLGDAPRRPHDRYRKLVRVRCACGAETVLDPDSIRRGTSTRCRSCSSKAKSTHGLSQAPVYRSWRGMHSRVGNRYGNSPTYESVTICDEWKTFEGFLAHPPKGTPGPGMALSRYGDKGNYEPTNCEWVPALANIEERWARDRVHVLSDGRPARKTAIANGIPPHILYRRIQRGWSVDEAATIPTGQRRMRAAS